MVEQVRARKPVLTAAQAAAADTLEMEALEHLVRATTAEIRKVVAVLILAAVAAEKDPQEEMVQRRAAEPVEQVEYLQSYRLLWRQQTR